MACCYTCHKNIYKHGILIHVNMHVVLEDGYT